MTCVYDHSALVHNMIMILHVPSHHDTSARPGMSSLGGLGGGMRVGGMSGLGGLSGGMGVGGMHS